MYNWGFQGGDKGDDPFRLYAYKGHLKSLEENPRIHKKEGPVWKKSAEHLSILNYTYQEESAEYLTILLKMYDFSWQKIYMCYNSRVS
jgi:hypothetical protein